MSGSKEGEPKGILKKSKGNEDATSNKTFVWDEANIEQTIAERPATRMKIDEPDTPYNREYNEEDDEEDEEDAAAEEALEEHQQHAEALQGKLESLAQTLRETNKEVWDEEAEKEAKRRAFKEKRAAHYRMKQDK